MSHVAQESADTRAIVEAESLERRPTSLLRATDACCEAGHDIAEVERGGGEAPVVVCVTCTEIWGRMEGLRSWQEHCPCCFSEAYPHGLRDLGITAQPISGHH